MMLLEALVWASAALVAYAYLGYPVAIGLAARLRPRPVRKPEVLSSFPRVSVVIVVHNEEATIARKLESCLSSDYPAERLEVLVVSDGSEDGTETIVRDFQGRGVRLLSLNGPRGKATGLNHGVAAVTGEIVVLTDARQRLHPGAVRELVRNFADPRVGAVSGELQLSSAEGSQASGVGAYWSYEKRIRRNESLFDSSVGVTGALYAIRRELFRPLDPATILDDVAIPMRVVLEGRRVVFESRAEAFDVLSDDSATELRRKVRTLAGNFQLVRLIPELLSPRRNRLWWQFVSHKLSRLAAPWALALVFLGSIALALTLASGTEKALFYRAAAAGQTLFYLLAAVGARQRARRVLRFRVSRLAYAFVLLNWASALALLGYVTGRARPDWKRRGDHETPIEHESTGGILVIRVGILGCGVIAQEHMRSIRMAAENDGVDVQVVAIADLDGKARAETRAKFEISDDDTYEDALELIEKAKPDAVHVTTPPASHYRLARAALEAGCHVFLEKPMTLHASEADSLFELAREKDRLLCVDFNHRFDRVFLEAMKLVEEGAVGRVCAIDSYYGFDLGTTPTGRYFREAYSHWVYSLPGGLFHNGLDHPLSVVVPFMKEPKQVLATAAEVGVLPKGVPGELKILLNDGERVASVTLSEAASPRFHYVTVHGDHGTLQVDLQNKRILRLGHKPGVPHYVTRALMNVNTGVRTLTGTVRTFWEVLRGRFTPYEGQRRIIAEFYRAVASGGPSPLPPEEPLVVTRIMDRVWEQIGGGGFPPEVETLERWAPGRAAPAPRPGRKRVLVTGASGFIGRHLVEALVERGEHDVRVLVRNLYKGDFLRDLPVEVAHGDLTRREDIARAMAAVDVVYHLGAAMSGTWESYEEATVKATESLVEESLARKVEAFVFASTIAVYGVPSPNGKPIDEERPTATGDLTFYMKSKIAAEGVVRRGIEQGLPASILRLGVVFGPGRPRISRMGYHAGRFHVLVGLNNMTIPAVYIDDVVEALLLAGSKPEAAGRTYNIVDDPKFKKLDFLRAHTRHTGQKDYFVFFPYTAATLLGTTLRSLPVKNGIVSRVASLLNPFHLRSCARELRFDNSRAKAELGWTPKGELDEQFRRTFQAP